MWYFAPSTPQHRPENLLELRVLRGIDDWIHAAVANQNGCAVQGECIVGIRDEQVDEVRGDQQHESTASKKEILGDLELMATDFAFLDHGRV